MIHQFADDKLPLFDVDGDGFSDYPSFRGYHWSGKDCNEFDREIYPGRKVWYGEKGIDYNCNGIHGVDQKTGKEWKELLCENSNQMGIVLFGDSAGAHFSIPESYVNVTQWKPDTFDDLWFVLSDEFDWPQKSGTTGWVNRKRSDVKSFYKKWVDLNRCNRNDYQNMGVNGARSTNQLRNMGALRRNQTLDHPVWIFFELVGNDVCSGHPGVEHMTTKEIFAQKVLEMWNYIDGRVPPGSHMVVTGLADGTVLYDALYNHTHPLNITYLDLYNFLNCFQASPCWGWMNEFKENRDATTQRAAELNSVYKELIANHTFKNFDIIYYDMMATQQQVIKITEAMGKTVADLIEPVDGFHPNEFSNNINADLTWLYLQRDRPQWIGHANPYNAIIDDQFPS